MQNTNPRGIGRSDHPCDPLSRWKTYAFSRRDGNFHWLDQHFEAVYNNSTDSYITIKLNGHVRTVVTSLAFSTNEEYELEFNRKYRMCHLPQEYADGWFWLVVNETSSTCQALPNPLVHFYQDSGKLYPLLLLWFYTFSNFTYSHLFRPYITFIKSESPPCAQSP